VSHHQRAHSIPKGRKFSMGLPQRILLGVGIIVFVAIWVFVLSSV
jgi:hypothetical protein